MKRIISPFSATVLLLGATLFASTWSDRRRPEQLAAPLATIGRQLGAWQAAADQSLDAKVLSVLLPTSYLSRSYQSGRWRLELFIAYYAQQRAGESMHSPKNCLPGAGWEIWKHGSAEVPVGGRTFTVNQYSIQNAGRRMLVFYWYQSKGRIIASEYLGKVLLVRDAIFEGRTAGSIVRIALADEPGAAEAGVAFAAAVIPQLERCFGSDLTGFSR